METLIISKEDCSELLTYEKCIPSMKDALLQISSGKAVNLQRMFVPNDNNTRVAIMPSTSNTEEVSGGKVIVFGNKETSQGIVPLFCTKTGRLLAITDAKVMTTVRTASTSAAATDVLAKKDSSVLAILGAGKQGRAHAIAISKIRDIKTINIWSYKEETINSCIEYLTNELPNINIVFCKTAKEAVVNADIICTTTAGSDKPILKGKWLKDGVHINGVGACNAKRLECDLDTLNNCKIYTDWTEASIQSSGNFAIPMSNGEFNVTDIKGEVGEVLLNKIEGRISNDEKTFFSSVGISIQDLISANVIYKEALKNKKGIAVKL
ncbi:MAG: ornithine cyclodeaminase family protein [bacterium]